MNALVLRDSIFAPVNRNQLEALLRRYAEQRVVAEHVAGLLQEPHTAQVLGFFLSGNTGERDRWHLPDAQEVFAAKGAVAALNSHYWQRALELTDVLQIFPQHRRDAWDEQIRKLTTPDFIPDNVLPTIEEMLLARGTYFAEKVDSIFRALSGHHATNAPGRFGQRMILEYVFSDFGSVDSRRAGAIADLRAVIAKFMGRDEPRWHITADDLSAVRSQPGRWQVLDGGALRVRAYKCGTVHLEIHPDMADRLNGVLHALHPHAIPDGQRKSPTKASRSFALLERPLPFAVLAELRALRWEKQAQAGTSAAALEFNSGADRKVRAEACNVLRALGGVDDGRDRLVFDYDAREVVRSVVFTGCIPDQQSHQFYPTPESLAERVLAEAAIDDTDACLEPSAGQGALAVGMPRERTLCIERSELHCKVLRAKGHQVVCADFIEWAAKTSERFDRICMNPPFTGLQWREHARAAAHLLRPGGRLVAILPATARDVALLKGATHSWSETIADAFADTSVNVVLAIVDRDDSV